MGRPDSSQGSAPPDTSQPPYREDYDDALDLDIDDLPPSYSDIPKDATSSIPAAPLPSVPSTTSPGDNTKSKIRPVDADATIYTTASSEVESWVARSVEDPEHLEKYIRQLATIPPRPQIFIHGSHTETSRDGKGKERVETITDFAILLDLKPYLFIGANTHTADGQQQGRGRKSWSSLRTVENSESVYRGTRFRKRGPRPATTGDDDTDDMLEAGVDNKPSLREWCHRFGASHAGLKCFTLRRDVVGFDAALFSSRVHHLIRQGLNYRGALKVELVVKNGEVHLLNDTAVNRWRATTWVRWLFYLTFLWLLAWPYLWLRTKKWAVAVAEWPFSRIDPLSGAKEYVSFCEDKLFDLWEMPIAKAALQGQRGIVLKHDELMRAQLDPNYNNLAASSSSTGWFGGRDGVASYYLPGLSTGFGASYRFGWGENC